MTANDLIESYVADVAVRLPRKQRNDVAFELRALLQEELQAKADTAGQGVDVRMATEMLRAFGHPGDVAARYLPTLTIIDPADGRKFLHASVIGLAIIWVLGLVTRLRQPIDSGWDLLSVLGQWWGGTVIPSLWWPGLLVTAFGAAAWTRRQWPQSSEWKSLAGDRLQGGRAGMAVGLVAMVCGLYLLIKPRWLLDALWGGHAAPAAYQALTYADAFLQGPAPYLLALITLNIPLFALAIMKGRWSDTLRAADTALSVSTCAMMGWAVLGGPIFLAPGSDQTVKFAMALIIAGTLVQWGIKVHRRVRPAPSPQARY